MLLIYDKDYCVAPSGLMVLLAVNFCLYFIPPVFL